MRYLVIIPAFNEARNLASVVQGALEITKDVLVIDDGSTDSTGTVLKKLDVKTIKQSHRGKGGALKAGFTYACENNYDWVITMDGDGQHDYREIPHFTEKMAANGTDVIVGSRMRDTKKMPFVRLVANRFMSRLISSRIGQSVPDTQCGFRAINCRVLRDVTLETSHYDTESEILIKAARAGFNISSVPVTTIYNGAPSSIHRTVDTIRFIKLLRKAGK
jgi:glycosyltransferase involved in cell wall biosynthesis